MNGSVFICVNNKRVNTFQYTTDRIFISIPLRPKLKDVLFLIIDFLEVFAFVRVVFSVVQKIKKGFFQQIANVFPYICINL